MIISDNGVALLKQLEGCKLTAYQDQGGVWTIGYGSTTNVIAGMTITQDEAEARLNAKLAQFCNYVTSCVKIDITKNQFDALVIFTYNVGDGAFHDSTMLKYVNNRSILAASEEFPKWDHVAHKENPGLLARRLAEQKLFLTV